MAVDHAIPTIAAVSFLNTRPLVHGLERRDDLHVRFGVPALLGDWLAEGSADAALVPAIDLARNWEQWRPISEACIASDGPTLTVRIFARCPIEEIARLHCDTDSHTSVVLARIMLDNIRGRQPEILPLQAVARDLPPDDAVLLIGDKVATTPMDAFPHELDLGEAWKRMTGLPFVFALWACRRDRDPGDLPEVLSAARDAGLAAVDEIVAEFAPPRGWPIELARRYLTRNLTFRLDARMRRGMREFFDRAAGVGAIPSPAPDGEWT